MPSLAKKPYNCNKNTPNNRGIFQFRCAVSRILSSRIAARTDGHLSSSAVTSGVKLPTKLGIAPGRVYHGCLSPGSESARNAAEGISRFQPYHLPTRFTFHPDTSGLVLSLWHWSSSGVADGRVGVTHYHLLRCSDFPLRQYALSERPSHAPERSDDSTTKRACQDNLRCLINRLVHQFICQLVFLSRNMQVFHFLKLLL